MTDRMYRALLGFLLLAALTFDADIMVYFLIVILFFEGVTGLLLSKIVCRLRNCLNLEHNPVEYMQTPYNTSFRFNFDSERAWRLVMGLVLALTYYFYEQLWFFPWFIGFAVFGAGVSGVCPALIAIRWAGFK